MRKRLQLKLRYLNAELENLFKAMEGYSHEQLNKKPAPDSWSAIQVMHHLIVVEGLAIKYCEKKLSFKPDLPKAGLKASLRVWVLRIFLLSPLKIKAPKGLGDEALPADDSLENVIKEWRELRNSIQKFIEEIPEEYIDKAVFKHPVAGRLSFKGMVDFYEMHFKSHRGQIFRALN